MNLLGSLRTGKIITLKRHISFFQDRFRIKDPKKELTEKFVPSNYVFMSMTISILFVGYLIFNRVSNPSEVIFIKKIEKNEKII